MTEVTEQPPPQQPPQQQAGDTDGEEMRHRQQLQSALSALPKKPSFDDDDAAAFAAGYERYTPPTSTALTIYSEDDDLGYSHLFDSPEDDSDAAGPALASATGGGGVPSAGYYPQYKPAAKNAFTGLSNQGATCYMNSLLQTMFMTPEFRQGLYQWQFGRRDDAGDAAAAAADDDDESGDDNIPFQLQKLFAKLQMRTSESISTKALTKSFGWTGADVFQQHDVQELCRVLFDAIERSFKGTVNETLVNDLYQGALKDYVQCHACGFESSRIDHFLDLSLVIRPFGSEEMMKSVEEAIELFLRPELLNQDNQWNCDRCKTKRDAIKGLKFAKLPYLLSLQLKRFDFDYATMNRIKLHNRVSFPKYLDMNSYVSGDAARGGSRGRIARKMSLERHELEAAASATTTATTTTGAPDGRAAVRRLSSMDETHALEFSAIDGVLPGTSDAAVDTWSAAFDPQDMIARNGPHVYELYSVLIHSGSALGGHYYAYIKSFETGQWFNFNDSHVSAISDDELQTAFGGSGSGSGASSYSARMSYSTCAYMLMYRLVAADKNVNAIAAASIPEYLQQKFRADEERARQAETERLEMAKKVLVRFFVKGSKPKNAEKAIHLYKTSTLRDAVVAGCAAFASEPDVVLPTSLANVRLRGYNDYNAMLSETFDGKEDCTLSALGIYAGQQLFIEVKSDGEAWESYDPFKLQLFVRRFVDTEALDDDDDAPPGATRTRANDLLARCLQVEDNATLGQLCALVAHKFGVPDGMKVRLLTKSGYGMAPVKVLTMGDASATMNLRLRMNLHLVNGTEVYMEETADLDAPSPAKAFFEREANMIVVNFKYLSRAAEPVRIDRRETVAALKAKIGAKLGLAPDKFKILRGVNSSGVEIKTVDSTLYNLSIGSNHTVFVLEGVPLNRGEYHFRVMLHRPGGAAAAGTSTSATPTPDAQLTVVNSSASATSGDDSEQLFDIDEVLLATGKDDAEFVFAGQLVISEEMQVEDIRTRVHALLVEKLLLAPEVAPSHLRLRDVRQNTMTQILVDGRKLLDASDSAVYELRGMVAQVLAAPESADPEHRVVEFVHVNRSKWRFSKTRRYEVVIPKATQLAYPLTYLAEVASVAFTIPVERLRFARVPFHRESCSILEVVSYQFVRADELVTARTPDYQELVLVVDEASLLEPMPHRERMAIDDFLMVKREEKDRLQRAKYSSLSSSATVGGGYFYHKPKEAALVIRTKSRSSDKGKKGGGTGGGGGSNASSSGGTAHAEENGVSIRAPTQNAAVPAVRAANAASSDTDEEDDDDDDDRSGGGAFMGKTDTIDHDVLADLHLLDEEETRNFS
ncbi:hypothetical protein PybrP1_009432 [[Pythium] brassicae (nom. inval.)]|nr:hypothetical protein PybrP1_009432 [[Pythium] brassicae (nom. inval.)]